MAVHAVFVLGSFCLILSLFSCGVSFLGPYWLGNVTTPRPGQETQRLELDLSYVVVAPGGGSLPSMYSWRGLWAQCHVDCQWFWQHDYRLQSNKFTPLHWHLATQILYFIGVALLLLCEVYARAQLCCMQSKSVYKALGAILVVSFVAQAAAIVTFGGFASSEYGARATASSHYTYFGWCYWLAVAGCIWTALAATCFVGVGFCRFHRTRTPKKATVL